MNRRTPSAAHPAAPPSPSSLPLSRLLSHSADAVQAVRAGQSLTDALARCPAEARPGTQALSFHALRWLGSATAARALLVPKTPPPAVDALLLVAIALLWPSDEPPAYAEHTLVNQAVSAATARAKASAAFVNAVLRRFLRERGQLVEAAQRDPVAVHNHPLWWVERLQQDWPAQWQDILAASNRRPPMTLRVNTRRGTVAAYLERLAAAGLPARAIGAQGVMLDAPCPVSRLPGFADGDVSVQDAAAQLAAPLLLGAAQPAPGARLRILDACAAPGGKTAHLLELADAEVLAIDRDPERLAKVDQTLQRLSLKARTRAADAAEPDAWWDHRPFDAILLDAPCTASGIVRRHPDVRWLRRAGDVPALARTQAQLLDALWPLLRPGGHLLYCTCSVFRAEGEAQIDAFLQRQPRARPARHPASPGHLLPLTHNPLNAGDAAPADPPDGFFYALLEKT